MQVQVDAVDAGTLMTAIRTGELEQSARVDPSLDQRSNKGFLALVVVAQALWIGTLAYLVFVTF